MADKLGKGPHGPVSEHFMRHHYGARKGEEEPVTHAPKFWAAKLPREMHGTFWGLIESGFSGETAYYRVTQNTDLAKELAVALDTWTQCHVKVLEQTEWLAGQLLAAPADVRQRIARLLTGRSGD